MADPSMAPTAAVGASMAPQTAPTAVMADTTVTPVVPATYNVGATYDYPQTGCDAAQFAPGAPAMTPA